MDQVFVLHSSFSAAYSEIVHIFYSLDILSERASAGHHATLYEMVYRHNKDEIFGYSLTLLPSGNVQGGRDGYWR